MRIGITGASGFIGSHLLRALKERGISVSAFHRSHPARSPTVTDLIPFVKDKELLYHLGGVNRGGEEEIINGNILGTLHLVQAVKSTGKPIRIIFASSSQVYRPPRKNLPLLENHVAEPSTLYGVGKKAAEDFIRLSGLDYILLRLANVYGPGCQQNYNSVIATFCYRAAKGLPLVVKGDGKQGCDWG